MSSGCRHPDFEKIHSAFLSHYIKDPALGEARYAEWVKVSGLDETKSYYAQGAARATKSKQSFEWANFLLQFVKEDQDARYYKVEALFPVESMNGDVFTKDEVLQAARSLTGKPNNLNHDPIQMLMDVEVVAAQFEDDCVECLVRILKTSHVIGMTAFLSALELAHLAFLHSWNAEVFATITGLSGTVIGLFMGQKSGQKVNRGLIRTSTSLGIGFLGEQQS
jgi:hypothetical protein